MLLLLPVMKFQPTRRILFIHGLFIIQMIFFGFHLIPHSATIRTLSGQLFIVGALYLLWSNVQNRWNVFEPNRSPLYYFGGVILVLLLMQLLVRAPFVFASALIEVLGLLGLATIVLAAVITVFDLCTLRLFIRSTQKIE